MDFLLLKRCQNGKVKNTIKNYLFAKIQVTSNRDQCYFFEYPSPRKLLYFKYQVRYLVIFFHKCVDKILI